LNLDDAVLAAVLILRACGKKPTIAAAARLLAVANGGRGRRTADISAAFRRATDSRS
jgi:hypothetical protein